MTKMTKIVEFCLFKFKDGVKRLLNFRHFEI
jgi:hypothetical protein